MVMLDTVCYNCRAVSEESFTGKMCKKSRKGMGILNYSKYCPECKKNTRHNVQQKEVTERGNK